MRKKYPGQRKPLAYPGGVSVVYSRVNRAFFVMWHDQVLRIIGDRKEAMAYAESLVSRA